METIAQLPCSSTGVPDPATATRMWYRFALVGIPLVAVFPRFFRLEQEGYANLATPPP